MDKSYLRFIHTPLTSKRSYVYRKNNDNSNLPTPKAVVPFIQILNYEKANDKNNKPIAKVRLNTKRSDLCRKIMVTIKKQH